MLQNEKMMCVKEAAYFLQMHPDSFRKWIKAGIVKPTVRIGQIYRFDRDDLISQLKERTKSMPRYKSAQKAATA